MAIEAEKDTENGKLEMKTHVNEKILLEEALTRTQFGKFNIVLVILSGLVLSTVLLETLSISFILPVSECDLKLNSEEKGLLSGISFGGIIASSHLWGFLADTQGRRKIILPTLLITFVITFISSFVQNFWLLVVLRFFSGFFISGASGTIYPYLGEFHDTKNRSRVLMGASFVFGVTCISLPCLAYLVINSDFSIKIPYLELDYKSWRLFLVVCGLPSIICFVVMLFLPESPKFIFSQGDEKNTIKILEKIYRINTGKDPKIYNVTALIQDSDFKQKHLTLSSHKTSSLLRSMWNQTSPLFKKPHLKNTMIACAMQFGTFTTSNGMFMFFPNILNRMAEFIDDNPNQSATICAMMDSTRINILEVGINSTSVQCVNKLELSTFEHAFVLEIFYALGFAIIGLIINSVGKLAIILFVLFGCGLCGFGVIFSTIPLLSIYLYLILLLCGLVVNVVNASTVDLFPTHLRAMAICISLMCGRLGSVVGSNIVGLLLDTYCSTTFAFSATLLCLSGVLSIFIPNITQKNTEINTKSHPDPETQ